MAAIDQTFQGVGLHCQVCAKLAACQELQVMHAPVTGFTGINIFVAYVGMLVCET